MVERGYSNTEGTKDRSKVASKSIGTVTSIPLASSTGMEHNHPILDTLGRHGGKVKRDKYVLLNSIGLRASDM